jgi:peptide/nickel transport system ATP-binding protein
MTSPAPILSVRDLRVVFGLDEGEVRAVDGVSFDVQPGQIVGIVGESGCGKSVTMKALLQLVDAPGRIAGGSIARTVPYSTSHRSIRAGGRSAPYAARRSR